MKIIKIAYVIILLSFLPCFSAFIKMPVRLTSPSPYPTHSIGLLGKTGPHVGRVVHFTHWFKRNPRRTALGALGIIGGSFLLYKLYVHWDLNYNGSFSDRTAKNPNILKIPYVDYDKEWHWQKHITKILQAPTEQQKKYINQTVQPRLIENMTLLNGLLLKAETMPNLYQQANQILVHPATIINASAEQIPPEHPLYGALMLYSKAEKSNKQARCNAITVLLDHGASWANLQAAAKKHPEYQQTWHMIEQLLQHDQQLKDLLEKSQPTQQLRFI